MEAKPTIKRQPLTRAKVVYITTNYSPESGVEIDLIIKSQDPMLPLLAAHGKIVRCVVDESDCTLFYVSVELLAAN